MLEPLCPMKDSQGSEVSSAKKPGDSDKLWLVVRSLKNAEGKMVRYLYSHNTYKT